MRVKVRVKVRAGTRVRVKGAWGTWGVAVETSVTWLHGQFF